MSFLRRNKSSSASPSTPATATATPSSPPPSPSAIPTFRKSPSRLSLRRNRSSLPLQTPPPALPSDTTTTAPAEDDRRKRRTSLKSLFSGSSASTSAKSPGATRERPKSVVEGLARTTAATATAATGGSLGRHQRAGSTPADTTPTYLRRRLSSQAEHPAPAPAPASPVAAAAPAPAPARPSTPPAPAAAAAPPSTPPSTSAPLARSLSLASSLATSPGHVPPFPAPPSLSNPTTSTSSIPIPSPSAAVARGSHVWPSGAGKTAHDLLEQTMRRASASATPPGSPREAKRRRPSEGSPAPVPEALGPALGDAPTAPAVPALTTSALASPVGLGLPPSGSTPAWWTSPPAAASSPPSTARPSPSPTPSTHLFPPALAETAAASDRIADERPTFLDLPHGLRAPGLGKGEELLAVDRGGIGGEDDEEEDEGVREVDLASEPEMDGPPAVAAATAADADGGAALAEALDLTPPASPRAPPAAEAEVEAVVDDASVGPTNGHARAFSNGRSRPPSGSTTPSRTSPPSTSSSTTAAAARPSSVVQPGSPVFYHLPARKQVSHAFTRQEVAELERAAGAARGARGLAGTREDVFGPRAGGGDDDDDGLGRTGRTAASPSPAPSSVVSVGANANANNALVNADDDGEDEDDDARDPPTPSSPALILAAVRLERVSGSPVVSRAPSPSASARLADGEGSPVGRSTKPRALADDDTAAVDDEDPVEPPRQLSFFPLEPSPSSPRSPSLPPPPASGSLVGAAPLGPPTRRRRPPAPAPSAGPGPGPAPLLSLPSPLPLILRLLPFPLPLSLLPSSIHSLATSPNVDVHEAHLRVAVDGLRVVARAGVTVVKWGVGWWVLIPLRAGQWALGASTGAGGK